jgi:hypothetical protein
MVGEETAWKKQPMGRNSHSFATYIKTQPPRGQTRIRRHEKRKHYTAPCLLSLSANHITARKTRTDLLSPCFSIRIRFRWKAVEILGNGGFRHAQPLLSFA